MMCHICKKSEFVPHPSRSDYMSCSDRSCKTSFHKKLFPQFVENCYGCGEKPRKDNAKYCEECLSIVFQTKYHRKEESVRVDGMRI